MYKFTNKPKDIYIFQHLESDSYYFEDFQTCEEAAENDWDDSFIDEDESIEEAKEKHLATFESYTSAELLKKANENYGFALKTGLFSPIL